MTILVVYCCGRGERDMLVRSPPGLSQGDCRQRRIPANLDEWIAENLYRAQNILLRLKVVRVTNFRNCEKVRRFLEVRKSILWLVQVGIYVEQSFLAVVWRVSGECCNYGTGCQPRLRTIWLTHRMQSYQAITRSFTWDSLINKMNCSDKIPGFLQLDLAVDTRNHRKQNPLQWFYEDYGFIFFYCFVPYIYLNSLDKS